MQYIGILGAIPGCGATHVAISISTGLKSHGNVAVVGDFSILAVEAGFDFSDNEGQMFTYNGVDWFIERPPTAWFKQHGYDYVIVDYGSDYCDDFLRSDYPVVVIPGRLWQRGDAEIRELYDRLCEESYIDGIIIVSPFSTAESRKVISEFASESPTIIFPDYEDDPFSRGMDISFIVGGKEKHGLFRRKKRVSEIDG